MWLLLTFLTLCVTSAGLDGLNFAVAESLWYSKCRQKTGLLGSSRVKKYSQTTFREEANWQTWLCVSHSNVSTCSQSNSEFPWWPDISTCLLLRAESSSLRARYFFLIVFSAIWGYPVWYSDFFRDLDNHTPFITFRVGRKPHYTQLRVFLCFF